MSSRLQELQGPFTDFYYITWVRWMTALMWTCGETPLSKLWPGRTSCFILHRANIQFVSTQLFYPVIFLKRSCLVRVHPSSERCDAKHVRYTKDNKSWQQQHFIKVFKLFACSGSPHHPPTSLYIPKIVSLISISSRFYLAGSKLD